MRLSTYNAGEVFVNGLTDQQRSEPTASRYFRMRTCLPAILLCFSASAAYAVPTLHNDHDSAFLEALHIDETVPHYEYEEELERGKIEQEIEFEINELLDIEEHILKQELEVHNDTGVDPNPRTNFFSNDDHGNSAFLNDVFAGGNDFYFSHQLPPSVSPDVGNGPPFFNDFDFTADLIEVEYELEGWTTEDPNNSTYEVRITDGMSDVATLGALEFGELTSEGIYEFEFEFEQYESPDYVDVFISPEIYLALADGIFEIHIVRTTGSGDLYLEESELELEKPAVPEPSTLLLLGPGLLGLFAFRRRRIRG